MKNKINHAFLTALCLIQAACQAAIPHTPSVIPAPILLPVLTETPVPSITPPPQEPIFTAPTPSAGNDLSIQSLRNMQLTMPVSRVVVQLKDGFFEGNSGVDYLLVKLVEPAAFGDINGDGLSEAAAVMGENMGGSGVFKSLIVVANKDGKPALLASANLGDRVNIQAINIQDRQIIVDMVEHGSQDPLCCPTQPATWTLALTKSGLINTRITTHTPSGAERTITIDSPADGSAVSEGNEVRLKGKVSISPFENNLVLRIFESMGTLLDEVPVTVDAPDMGGPGTFDQTIDLSKVPPGMVVRMALEDVSMADGSPLAMASVEIVRK